MNEKKKMPILLILLFVAHLVFIVRVYAMDEGRYQLYDDAFISFRYANNLSRGMGLVFNPGERVEGYTNFLWTVILAGAMRLGSDPILAAKVLGLFSGSLILILMWFLAQRLDSSSGVWSTVPVLLIACTASLARFSLSGMETLVFTAWLLLALCLDQWIRHPLGDLLLGFTLSMAALTRPEGVLFFIAITFFSGFEKLCRGEKKSDVLRASLLRLAAFSAIFLPYFLWRYSYYGYLLPNTFYAKVGGLSLNAISRGFIYLRNELLLLNFPLLLWGITGFRALKHRGVPTMLGTLLTYMVYLVLVGGDDWAVFGPRFIVVILPWLAILGFVALKEFFKAHRFYAVVLTGAVVVMTLGLSVWEARAYQGVVRTMNRGWWTAAEWLVEEATPKELLAVDAAGIMPFYTDMPSVDMLGLNDLHIAHLSVPGLGGGLSGHEKFDPVYVLERDPTYITSWLDIQGNPISPGLEFVTEQIQQNYELTAVFLMRIPELGEEAWLDMSDNAYNETVHENGYIYGIFQRRILPCQ